MVATISYYIARVIFYLRREIVIGSARARADMTIMAPKGFMICGAAVDDHENGYCEEEEAYYLPGGDDEDED